MRRLFFALLSIYFCIGAVGYLVMWQERDFLLGGMYAIATICLLKLSSDKEDPPENDKWQA